jgi:peptidyl-prolyl cis-trans isomerase D
MAVVRVIEHEEAAVRPFESVQEEILSTLKREQAAAEARRRGEELLAGLRQGSSLEQLIAETGAELIERGPVTREERESPPAVLTSLFRMPRPQEGGKSYGEAVLANGDFAVIILGQVTDGSVEDLKQRGGERAIAAALSRARGDTYFRHLVQNLRDNADIQMIKREE